MKLLIGNIKGSLGLLGTLLFFVFAGIYFANNSDALNSLLEVSLVALIGLAALKLVRMITTGISTKLTLEVFDISIGMKETAYLALLTSAGNFFGPLLGGAGIRAVYLKQRHKLSYAKFMSTLYSFYLLTFSVNSLIGLIALSVLYIQDGYSVSLGLMAGLFAAIFLFTLGLFAFKPAFIEGWMNRLGWLPVKIRESLVSMSNSWIGIRENHRLVLRLCLVSVLVVVFAALEATILYALFADQYSISSVIIYTVFGSLAILISFTPGAIGIKEGLYLATTSLIMLNSEEIIQMATVDRGVAFLLLLALFIFSKFARSGLSLLVKK